MEPEPDEPAQSFVVAAWVIAGLLLVFVLRFDLLPALLAGLLVFELVHLMTLRLNFVRELFVEVIGAQTTRRMKPHPEPLRFAAAAMQVAPEECLMIGDTTIDIRTGVAAGAQTVGVLCGFGLEDELRETGAQLILPTTSDLLAVLCPSEDPLGKSASVEPS